MRCRSYEGVKAAPKMLGLAPVSSTTEYHFKAFCVGAKYALNI